MTYKIGDRVLYTGNRDGKYMNNRKIGWQGTVVDASNPGDIQVKWDSGYSKNTVGGCYGNNLEHLQPAMSLSRDLHLDEQITRAEWHVKPPVHGKDVPMDDPRVAAVADAIHRAVEDPNGSASYEELAVAAITALREYLQANRPKVTEWKLTLNSVAPHKMIQSIKAVRTYSGLGLKEAKDLVEGRLPRVVNQSLTEQEVEQARYDFTAIGAEVTFTEV
jgi:large subunit ribosomal protein L7/L12